MKNAPQTGINALYRTRRALDIMTIRTTWRRIGKNLFYFGRPKVTIPANFYLSVIGNQTVQVEESVISPTGCPV